MNARTDRLVARGPFLLMWCKLTCLGGEQSRMDFHTLDAQPETAAPSQHSERHASVLDEDSRGSPFGRGSEAHVETETAAVASRSRPAWRLERKLLERLIAALGHPPISIALWSGEAVSPPGVPVQAGVQIADRATLWKVLLDPQYQFCRGYCEGRIKVAGNLLEFLRTVERTLLRRRGPRFSGQGLSRWIRFRRPNTLAASRENIHRHYDLGNDFYSLWLDEQLLYTCAYYARPEMTLEEAQIAKMDHVCRKLWLRPDERVVEAGCGWGALALYMARKYGVRVRAYNISREQVRSAQERARAEGLDERVEFIEDDWRNIAGRYDAFVSVGMLEHVGPANYTRLGDVINRCLKSDGRGLIHTIGNNAPRRLDKWTERRIFPGAQPPALSQMTRIFEPHGFSVLDVENLRLHYARTLEQWLERFESAEDAVRGMFDEEFVRTWRLYLSASIAAFESGWLQLFQVLFAPGTTNDVPWTRAQLYVATAESPDRFCKRAP